jgi:hypothetical protein
MRNQVRCNYLANPGDQQQQSHLMKLLDGVTTLQIRVINSFEKYQFDLFHGVTTLQIRVTNNMMIVTM